MAILIDTHGNISTVSPAKGKKFTLDEMQKHVGGPIKHIPFRVRKTNRAALPVSAKGKPFCAGWCDEEGKVKGAAPNRTATNLFDCGFDFLCGPVLLTFAGEA
jgi:hypothetical protein